MLCRHCNRVPSNRPRGLCWSCYYRPGVRESVPVHEQVRPPRRRGPASAACRCPDAPTERLPGSPEKVLILMEAPASARACWHPADAPMDVESRKLGVA